MLILAGVAISLTLGKNGIFNRAISAKEDYKIAEIREKVELAISEIYMREVEQGNEVTIEKVLQELLDNKTFKKIDKVKQTGYIENYEVKLKYNEKSNVVIEYIKKATGVTYTLEPSTYTNAAKVTIKLVAQEKIKSITKPDGTVVPKNGEKLEISYEVTENGTYKFIVENEQGKKEDENVVVDIIDREKPQVFTITAESTTGEIKITGTAEDTEANETSVKSGISHYKYYAKLTTEAETEYKEYDTNEIRKLPTGDNLPAGTYNVYAKAFDKAGNWIESNTTTVTVAEWIQIWDEAGLRDIANGLDKKYVLMKDIALEQDWTTIGYASSNMTIGSFNGILNGNFHKITNIKAGASGMFYLIWNGTIKNITIEGEIASSSGGSGLLTGTSYGTIDNVKAICSITTTKASYDSPIYFFGGIVGINMGELKNSYASLVINPTHNSACIGGLAGQNKGTVKNSTCRVQTTNESLTIRYYGSSW